MKKRMLILCLITATLFAGCANTNTNVRQGSVLITTVSRIDADMDEHQAEINSINKFIINGDIPWDRFIGQIIFHKLINRTFIHFENNDWLKYIPGTILKIMKEHKKIGEIKYSFYLDNLKELLLLFSDNKINYCIVKGFAIATDLFDLNMREYKDVDVLIPFEELSKLNKLLIENGYIRGDFNENDESIETSRKLDLNYILNTHQTLPYIKMINESLNPAFFVDVYTG